MGKMSREAKLFKSEHEILEKYTAILNEDLSREEARDGLRDLTKRYKNLLEQTRFLTWISGRLERRLHRTNRELNANNAALHKTLMELMRVQASRSAYAIIYSIAIVLFVLEEFFLEPFINAFGDSPGFSVLIKLLIVLMLKIGETILEKRVTRTRKPADLAASLSSK